MKKPPASEPPYTKSLASKAISQDVLAASRLGLDAIAGVTDIVEALQQAIVNPLGINTKAGSVGISNLIYTCLRKVNALLTTGVDSVLVNDQQQSAGVSRSDAMHAAVSALNGVMGDRLVAQSNALAIKMAFRHKGKRLSPDELKTLIERSDGRVLLMVHGLCMNDLQWTRKGHNHGEKLAEKFNMLPVYLHYNSGRHISENGRELAHLLQDLTTTTLPVRFSILAHSMGGLVSRSACHYANQSGHSWLAMLDKIMFLGTPHHGAPLEKGGNWLGQLLNISPYSAPFVPLVKLRSSGVTDLRYGNLIDEDWRDKDRFAPHGDLRNPLPLPTGVACYALATSLAKMPNGLRDKHLGDGLVGVDSALGRHITDKHNLQIAEQRRWLGYNINHMDLLCSAPVYAALSDYLAEEAQG